MPLCMGKALEEDMKLLVAGWGKTTNVDLAQVRDFIDLGVSQRTLQKLEIPLMGQARCRSFFPRVTRRHICAGGDVDRDSCNGDSGGPLIAIPAGAAPGEQQMFLMGVVSSGTKRCGIGRPGIYTRMSDFEDWIKRTMRP